MDFIALRDARKKLAEMGVDAKALPLDVLQGMTRDADKLARFVKHYGGRQDMFTGEMLAMIDKKYSVGELIVFAMTFLAEYVRAASNSTADLEQEIMWLPGTYQQAVRAIYADWGSNDGGDRETLGT